MSYVTMEYDPVHELYHEIITTVNPDGTVTRTRKQMTTVERYVKCGPGQSLQKAKQKPAEPVVIFFGAEAEVPELQNSKKSRANPPNFDEFEGFIGMTDIEWYQMVTEGKVQPGDTVSVIGSVYPEGGQPKRPTAHDVLNAGRS